MKKLLLLLIIPFLSFGQGWEQVFEAPQGSYGDIDGCGAQQTSDGGYVFLHTAGIIKTDSSGQEEWVHLFPSDENPDFIRVFRGGDRFQQTLDGGYIITGVINIPDGGIFGVGQQVILLKITSNGQEEWREYFGGPGIFPNLLGTNSPDYGICVQQANDGGYIIIGNTSSFFDVKDQIPQLNTKIYIIKTNSYGQEQWSHFYSSGDSEDGISVRQTTDGGYILCGNNLGENKYIRLIKLNPYGETEWDQNFEAWGGAQCEDVKQTVDGGYILIGKIPSSGNYDVYMLKINQDGEEDWYQTFGGLQSDQGYSIQQTYDGGYIITGHALNEKNEETNVESFLIKTNLYGQEEWVQFFELKKFFSVQQHTDGGYILAGTKLVGSPDGYVRYPYLVKTNEWGNITSTIELPTSLSNRELIKTTDILGRETHSKGFNIEIYDDGSVEKKYIIK